MQYILFLKKFYLVPLLVNITVVLATGVTLGVFSITNLHIYQQIAPYLPTPNQDHHKFVLIEIADDSMDQQLNKIVAKLHLYQSKKIILDISHQNRTIHKNEVETLLKLSSKTEFIFPKYKYNTYKELSGTLKFYDISHLYKKNNFFIFQNSATSESIDLEKVYPRNTINYNGTPPFSKFHSSDFFEKNITPELFKDKIVIISNFDNHYARLSGFVESCDAFIHLDHLALMLKSEMSKSWIRTFTPLSYIVFILLITLVWIYFAYMLSSLYSIDITFVLSIVLPIFFYWLLLAYWNILLPIAEILLLLPITTILLFRHWEQLKSQEELTLLDQLTKRLQDKVVHKTFFNSDNYWDDIIKLMNELFYLEKNIILEKVESEKYLKEVASHHCQFSDIHEPRRDSTREPYLSAIKTKMISKIERPFFNYTANDEEEYIVPLIYHNKIMGFWIFSLHSSNMTKMKNFKQTIQEYATEVSRLLFNRSQFLKNKKYYKKNLEELLNIEVKPKTIVNIENSLVVIDKRMLLDEVSLDAIHAKIVVYDLFGRIIQINRSMTQTLQEEEISAYTMTASQMLSQLTNISLYKIKNIIRTVISSRQPYTQLVQLNRSNKQYILNISAITKESIAHKFTVDYLFDTSGIVFEFHNFSYIENQYFYKKDIIYQTLINNAKRLAKLESLMAYHTESKNLLHHTIFSCNSLKNLIDEDTISSGDDLYPLDIVKIIRLSSEKIKTNYIERKIDFNIMMDLEIALVLLSIHDAQRYIEDLLTLLVEDSDESHTQIDITLNSKSYDREIILQSRGNGMPQEQLEHYLSSETTLAKFQFIQNAKQGIEKAMGNISFTSNIGEGIKIEILLKAVEL